MNRRKRRKGLRLDVERLPFKQKQYTVWDLVVKGCVVRVSADTKSCVISVRLGGSRPFETIGRVSPGAPYEYLRELAVKRTGELKREHLPRAPLRQLPNGDVETLRQALENYIAAHPQLGERTIEDYREILNTAAQTSRYPVGATGLASVLASPLGATLCRPRQRDCRKSSESPGRGPHRAIQK